MIRAHKVIEDLNRFKANYVHWRLDTFSEKEANKHVDVMIGMIKHSIKFQFGKFDDLMGMFSEKALKDMFAVRHIFQDDNEDLYFPFEVCWFEYDIPNGHCAVLVHYDHKNRSFSAVFFGGSKVTNNIWLMEPLTIEVDLNPDLDPDVSNVEVIQSWNSDKVLEEMNPEHISDVIQLPMCFLVMALKMLNCRNIGTVEKYPPKNLVKKRAKKNKPPLFRYKTLVIKPIGKRQEALAAQGLWKQAISYSMGHFKVYPPPGLFGKYPGRFWWQPQVRGNKKRGIIVKDYKISETESPEKKAKK